MRGKKKSTVIEQFTDMYIVLNFKSMINRRIRKTILSEKSSGYCTIKHIL